MQLAVKCRDAAERLSRLHGDFTLFNLIQWERSAGKWDVVVSAPWLSLNGAGIQQIVEGLRPFLSPENWLQTGSVIPFSPERPFVEAMTRRFFAPNLSREDAGGRLTLQEVGAFDTDDLMVDRAVIIIADRMAAMTNKIERQKVAA